MDGAKPEILLTGRDSESEFRLGKQFTLHYLTDFPDRDACFAAIGHTVRAVYYCGIGGRLDSAAFDKLPRLELISLISSGFDYVDTGAARSRGITVTNAGGANAVDVAEFAVGLLLDAGRNLSGGNQLVRRGLWGKQSVAFTRRLSGRPVGILGLGFIGLEIAKRCAAFDMTISYHNRHPRTDVPYTYYAELLAMARAVEILMIAAPGGAQTHHMVNREVIDALGPQGIIINVGRGTTIDEIALAAALGGGRLAAAGLDVLETEPDVPPELAALSNIVLTPHQASLTWDAVRSAFSNAMANIEAHFAGRPVATPVN